MDCTDMVIGMARGNSARIWDYYTRDRSTPQRDTYWGGENDLTAAVGWERDGVTTILFRKKLTANGFTDHDITDADMHVIWAVGQEPDAYSHKPASGLEKGEPSIPDFYRPDELKYHGRANRGIVTMNFFDEVKRSIGSEAGSALDFCGGEWKYPRTCSTEEKTCEYFARWEFDEVRDVINFTIQSAHTDKWTGIGFSDTPQMSLTDAVVGFVEQNGRFFLMDMWTTGYLQPILEQSQDLRSQEGKIEDGITTIKFSRKRDTKDRQDVAFTDDEGKYLIFPIKGGSFNGVNKKLKKHEETPIPSSEKIFIKACRTADGKPTFTTTPKPPQLMYQASLKFVELGDHYRLPVVGTKEYTELQSRIARSLRENTALGSVPGFQDVAVTKFKSEEFGEFEADMVVVVDKEAYEGKEVNDMTVEKALEETVKRGKVGRLTVDPESLKLKQPVSIEPSISQDAVEDEGFLTSTKLYIVIASIAALVLVALVQATCTIYKMTKKSSSQKEKLISQSAWKDYSAGGGHHTNYAYEHFDPHAEMDPKRQPQPPQQPRNGTADRRGGPQPQRYSRQPAGPAYSLPRNGSSSGYSSAPPPGPAGYFNSYDRRSAASFSSSRGPGDFPPDHYFMPSQRKYSGEVVRVYVDYNK